MREIVEDTDRNAVVVHWGLGTLVIQAELSDLNEAD